MTNADTYFAGTMLGWADPEAETIAALVGRGVDQQAASWLIFGGPNPGRHAWTTWVALFVSDLFASLREAVGL